MNDIYRLKTRLSKIGIELEFDANVPWIYLRKVNEKFVSYEFWNANHGFNVAWYSDNIKLESIRQTFYVIRQNLKQND